MQRKPKDTSASFVIIANLVRRALAGKLVTKPKKKFSRFQFDCTPSNGLYISQFLHDSRHRYPAANKADLYHRLRFILDVLLLNDVDVMRETLDIRANLDQDEQEILSQEETAFLNEHLNNCTAEMIRLIDSRIENFQRVNSYLLSLSSQVDALKSENQRLQNKILELEADKKKYQYILAQLEYEQKTRDEKKE